ncbi:MAG: UDP-3-O-acyl-N-acetylglucosamine deacetylase [Rubrimonas sp.]|uniref:UDP-3-O-acyl-N-acetylglucosamine deacetylase n=1 Tax=Rubrimonas sp. TaxID=2036015 RepID=UPI002FDE023C
MQRTLARSVGLSGVGLHGGAPARLTLRPAPADAGIVFCRIDVADRDQRVPARWDRVSDTRLNTTISNAEGVSVSTIEHLMAALAASGVDNALIDIDGPEIPIMDGSAAPFLRAIRSVGLAAQGAPRRAIRVLRPVSVRRGDATASLSPSDRFEIGFAIDFADAAIGAQSGDLVVDGDSFARELADCRTFGRLAEIEQLRRMGLALGGGLHNAIVVDGDRVLNPEGLRRSDEFVRHKMLDAVGDLALAGAPILGRYEGARAGHEVTNLLLRALFSDAAAWAWVDAPEACDDASSDALRIAAE